MVPAFTLKLKVGIQTSIHGDPGNVPRGQGGFEFWMLHFHLSRKLKSTLIQEIYVYLVALIITFCIN